MGTINVNKIPKEHMQEWLKCEDDISYFIFTHAKTYDPVTNRDRVAPRYPYLLRQLSLWETYNKTITAKSRQLFISNLAMLRYLWYLQWGRAGWQGRLISEKEELIIAGKNSLFGRIMHANDNLPDYLKINLVMTKKPMLIYNPITKNTLQGSSTTTTTGRGGTYDDVFLDEAAFYTVNFAEILSSVLPATKAAHIVSTPRGKNLFFNLYETAEKKLKEFEDAQEDKEYIDMYPVTLPWTVHPERGDEWFIKQTAGMTEVEIAQEYLLSFEASQQGRVFTLDPTQIIAKPREFTEEYNLIINKSNPAGLRLVGGMDAGVSDDTAITLAIKSGDFLQVIYCWHNNKMLPEVVYQTVLQDLTDNKLFGEYPRDKVEVLLRSAHIYADPSMWNTLPNSGTSVADDYIDLGLKLIPSKRQSTLDGIRKMQRWIANKSFKVSTNAQKVYDNLYQAHYPITRNKVVVDTAHFAHEGKGECNFNSHIVDSVKYMLSNIELPVGDTPPISIGSYLNEAGGVEEKTHIKTIREALKKQRSKRR